MRSYWYIVTLIASVATAVQCSAAPKAPIQHDDAHYALLAANEEAWARADQQVDSRLAEIRDRKGGRPPNIIYVLLDDVGYGSMGSPHFNYYNGFDTPNINALADEGLTLARMYSESVCTPTRVAFQTGRYPVRTGIGATQISVTGNGLSKDEVTLAETLSQRGYNTVHIGKWHLGDIEEAWPHRQGFDYAEFPVHQQGQLALWSEDAADANVTAGQFIDSAKNDLALDPDFHVDPAHMVVGLVAKRGEEATEVGMEPGEAWTEAKYRELNLRYQASMMEQLEDLAARDAPFFLNYWPLYPLTFVRSGVDEFASRNGGTMAESMQEVDSWIGDMIDRIDELGIAENTLIVVMGDNGPFIQYMGVTGQAQRLHRGGKGEHLEGGIRVDAFARWKGVIEAGSFAGDMIWVGDLFTTLSRIGGATEFIPRDRIIDGVDQSALLLLGETHGRRDHLFVYEGNVLKSIIKEHYKAHLPPPGKNPLLGRFFNLLRDPREENGVVQSESFKVGVWTGRTFADMARGHMMIQKKFPHRPPVRGEPYTGITNLRPETIALKKALIERQRRRADYLREN